jgi:hypothetical protein
MRVVLRRTCTRFSVAVFGFAALFGGLVSSAAEPESAAATAGKKYTATAYLV